MVFGLSSARDSRRRRVLTEEVMSTAIGSTISSESASSESATGGPSYAEGASRENQPHLSDLVPRRYTTILLAVIGAASIVLGLEYLHVHAADLAEKIAGRPIAALDLSAPGALAVWFSSMTLMLCGAMSVLIYSLRKHKIDDYPGRYRIWLWAAIGWIALSINTTAPLHGAYVDLMTYLTGWTAGPQGAYWWLTPMAIIFGAIGVRVLLDVRRCRMAFVTLALAHIAWAAALAVYFGWLPIPTWATSTMIVSGAAMGGHVALLTGLALYARYVLLDVEGLVPVRAPKHQEETSGATRRREISAHVKIDPPHATGSSAAHLAELKTKYQPARPVVSQGQTQWVDGSQTVDDLYDDRASSGAPKRRLSKSERKRLRKLKAQQRQR